MTTFSYLSGTAFDLFISLDVLHQPREFGLRPSWAAGIRSRVAAPWRGVLETYHSFLPAPLPWIASLDEPRDAASALNALEKLAPAERLPALALMGSEVDPRLIARLESIHARGAWDPADQDFIKGLLQKSHIGKASVVASMCEAWSHLEKAGEEYLTALRMYYDVFFRDEEERIAPALTANLAEVKLLAQSTAPGKLIEHVTKGVQFTPYLDAPEIILAPSYWGSPLIFFNKITPDTLLLLYGARPEHLSLITDDPAPEALLRGLEALADPTRLRILYYLRQQPQTPTQLAGKLRLRAPTVVHHLRQLRIAGLVRISLESDTERRYMLRSQALEGIWDELDAYLLKE